MLLLVYKSDVWLKQNMSCRHVNSIQLRWKNCTRLAENELTRRQDMCYCMATVTIIGGSVELFKGQNNADFGLICNVIEFNDCV